MQLHLLPCLSTAVPRTGLDLARGRGARRLSADDDGQDGESPGLGSQRGDEDWTADAAGPRALSDVQSLGDDGPVWGRGRDVWAGVGTVQQSDARGDWRHHGSASNIVVGSDHG